jgi:hypothetical protein
MAVRYRRQGLGKELRLGFGGDISFGGLIDQSLANSVPDPAAMRAMRLARTQHPLLKRGMRHAEVWGDCVGDLQTSVTALSLVSPFTLHAQRSRTNGGGLKGEAQRAHPLQVEALVDANVDFVSLANAHSMDFHEEGLLDTWEVPLYSRARHRRATLSHRCPLPRLALSPTAHPSCNCARSDDAGARNGGHQALGYRQRQCRCTTPGPD